MSYIFSKRDQLQHKFKVAFFDRDGTINYDYADADWATITTPIIIPDAIKVLHLVLELGYKIIIITNQYLIGEKIISLEQYNLFSNHLIAELSQHGIPILDVFFCPHSRDFNCNCRKPNTGLIDQAILKYPNISLSESIIVGDAQTDIKLAQRLNMKSFGIGLKGNIPNCTYVNCIGELLSVLDK